MACRPFPAAVTTFFGTLGKLDLDFPSLGEKDDTMAGVLVSI